jgi:beta-xylosidase
VQSQTKSEVLTSEVWVADNGDGTYKNPILHADYSDPDVVRVGDDYYMVSSSFNCVPAIPILHSKDLVNWQLIGHALQKLQPTEVFDLPQHGKGVWAPCIRFHKDEFYIYYPDPDFGIYLIKAKNITGPWSEPILVKGGKGVIDPAPLWDDDGNAYLTYAYAASRAKIKNIIVVCPMNSEGTKVTGDGVIVFDGEKAHPTVEGPKFYKRNGYYYIFAPAGGIATGWQLILRSKNIYGPYEEKIALAQGNSETNGPRQGAWVDTKMGEDWYFHFQDKGAYGRIVHLQPMKWINDWPVIGIDEDGDGTGDPVLTYKKPNIGATYPIITPAESDEFNGHILNIQWQWHGNPKSTWGFPSGNFGYYRLYCQPKAEITDNLSKYSNLLLQKFPSEEFTTTTKFDFHSRNNGDEVGLLIMGIDYQYISAKQEDGELYVKVVQCIDAINGCEEKIVFSEKASNKSFWFRVYVDKGAHCTFSYSLDGKIFKSAGQSFQAKEGKWIGTKVGLFAMGDNNNKLLGNVDVDWFRIQK